MSLLNAAMNFETFTSVSAAAIDVTTSATSSCGSAHANTATMQIKPALRTIARIDLNVLLRQIARPEARRTLASATQDETNQALTFVQLFLEIGLGKIRSQAAAAHGHVLEIDVYLARVQRHSGVAGSRDDPAPVGIGASYGGLD